MKSHLRHRCLIAAFVTIVGLAALPVAAQDFPAGIIPPDARPFGMTYGEWSAKWWQWALSLAANQNPFFDEGGSCTNGANGQADPGPVWFLTGVINASGMAVGNCSVPAGKALFFPVINAECSTLEPDPFHGANEAELRACATGVRFGDLFAEVDGVAIPNLNQFVKQSPLFTFTVPLNNVLGVAAGTGQSVANGAYLMLAPLPVGDHIIHFVGTFPDFGFALDITYNLGVVDRRPNP